jgi:hypothetical protein
LCLINLTKYQINLSFYFDFLECLNLKINFVQVLISILAWYLIENLSVMIIIYLIKQYHSWQARNHFLNLIGWFLTSLVHFNFHCFHLSHRPFFFYYYSILWKVHFNLSFTLLFSINIDSIYEVVNFSLNFLVLQDLVCLLIDNQKHKNHIFNWIPILSLIFLLLYLLLSFHQLLCVSQAQYFF